MMNLGTETSRFKKHPSCTQKATVPPVSLYTVRGRGTFRTLKLRNMSQMFNHYATAAADLTLLLTMSDLLRGGLGAYPTV
jgi:hypothetical protein